MKKVLDVVAWICGVLVWTAYVAGIGSLWLRTAEGSTPGTIFVVMFFGAAWILGGIIMIKLALDW